MITKEVKKHCLESAFLKFLFQDPFFACFLQEINVSYNYFAPTAYIAWKKEKDEFELGLNPDYFCSFELDQRVAILFHEVLHFMHKHLVRFKFEGISEEERKLQNIAMDMAINQYITNKPEGWVDVKDYKYYNKANKVTEAFPLNKPAEVYLELLKDPKNKKLNQGVLEKYMPNDEHIWEELSEEQKKKMLEESQKVLNRTLEKSSTSFSNLPDYLKDLFQHLEGEIAKLDYKTILRQAIKRTLAVSDRSYTWKRPSKRYGVYSPGTETGKLPSLEFLTDTSGSISHAELNQAWGCLSGFLKACGKKCRLSLWHTEMYHTQPIKLRQEVDASVLQSGGTLVASALAQIKKTNPNLAIIFTDGYFEQCEYKGNTEIIWLISKGGSKEHPMKHVGKTIPLESLL